MNGHNFHNLLEIESVTHEQHNLRGCLDAKWFMRSDGIHSSIVRFESLLGGWMIAWSCNGSTRRRHPTVISINDVENIFSEDCLFQCMCIYIQPTEMYVEYFPQRINMIFMGFPHFFWIFWSCTSLDLFLPYLKLHSTKLGQQMFNVFRCLYILCWSVAVSNVGSVLYFGEELTHT